MRLAYLCNVYPAVSHSFVRREIEGLEALGHDVHRFSIRPSQPDLPDPADAREAKVTRSILESGLPALVVATLGLLLTRPIKSFAALGEAMRLSPAGIERRARHLVYWLEAAWLVRRLEEDSVEHLHAHFGTNPAAVATIARAWGGPPFSFTAHGPDEFDAPVALSLSSKIDMASFVVAISNYGRAQLMRWSDPEQWGKIIVVRCGLDASFLQAEVDPVPAKSVEFVCVARLSAQKGLLLLIAACDRLQKAGKYFTLTIIGDGELRQSIENEIRDRGLSERIVLTGSLSSTEIRQHLRAARAFVLPSFAEGLPVVLMEALALGRPVIATAVAGIPELVDQDCGWLIPAGSVDAIVKAMEDSLAAPPDELAEKGKIGRVRIEKDHDARRNAALIAAAISKENAPSDIR